RALDDQIAFGRRRLGSLDQQVDARIGGSTATGCRTGRRRGTIAALAQELASVAAVVPVGRLALQTRLPATALQLCSNRPLRDAELQVVVERRCALALEDHFEHRAGLPDERVHRTAVELGIAVLVSRRRSRRTHRAPVLTREVRGMRLTRGDAVDRNA